MFVEKDSSFTVRVVVAVALLFAYPLYQVFYNIYLHPLAKFPGPKTWGASRLPFIRSLISGTIVQDIEQLHRKYGPVLRIAPNEITFAKAEAWTDIFMPRPGHLIFPKDPLWWGKQPGVPESLISIPTSEGHARMRKLLLPGFTRQALMLQEPIIQKYVGLFIGRLREKVAEGKTKGKATLDIVPWFNYTTFDIFGDLGFGESFECLQHSRYHPWIELLFNSVKAASFVISARFYPAVEFILMKCIPPSLKKMKDDHYCQIVDKVQRRLNWEVERPDLMSHVIKQNGSKDKRMTQGEVEATFMVLTTAGSETTATVLSGTINYLISNPKILNILVSEVRGRFSSESKITLDALEGLPYLNAVIHEGLRLCPPIPIILPRLVPKGGATVCGKWMPGGTSVSLQAWSLFRDPDCFHRPASYIPERWLPSAMKEESLFFHDQRQAVQPFSIGSRNCMGRLLAWAEMRLIIARLVWAFDVKSTEGTLVKWDELKTFLLVEKRPIIVSIQTRST